jgi:FLVCR family MFS transporter
LFILYFSGLRVAVLLAAGVQFIGTLLRCFPPDTNWLLSTILVCCGQTISGLVAPIPLSGGVLLSATWFPSNQRTFSTAVVMAGSFTGSALSFLIGPILVDDVAETVVANKDGRYVLTSEQEKTYFSQISAMFIMEAGLMGILFLGIFLHFPDRPPKPPSRSSGSERVDFKSGLSKLLRNFNFLFLASLYGVSCGVYSGWCSVLDQNLEEFGVGQKFAGWLGFIAVISGAFSGIFFSL